MDLSALKGNEHIKRILQKPFHAYIIDGAEGSGRHTLLRLMTQAFVCSSPAARPCGKCSGCRKFLSSNHPDVTYIGSDIKTDGLRRVLSDLPYKPNEAEKRCFIFDSADKLSVQNQNILLKTLEDPPGYAVFMLLCSSAEGLLETVRSRCITLTLAPLPDGEIESFLAAPAYAKYGVEKKREALAFCDGYIGKAIRILENDKTDEYALCRRFVAALIGGDTVSMLDICSFKKRDELILFIRSLRQYLANCLRDCDLRSAKPLDAAASAMGRPRLVRLCSALNRIAESSEININSSLWSVRTVRDCLAAYALKL